MRAIKHHQRQVQKVCEFIDANLDETFSLEQLSEQAASSKYHFHRIFKSSLGISTIQYQLLAKLKRASFRLAFEREYSITDIAFEAGFDSPEAFSRAFSRTFSQTPSQFRHQPEWQCWHSKYDFRPPIYGEQTMEVKLVDFEQREVALIEHKGNPKRVYETAAKFIDWRKTTGLSPINSSHTFGIPHSDPNDTPEDEFRFDICGAHQGAVPDNPFGVKAGVIPAGRCAVAIHKGSHDKIGDTIYYLYQQWLPESGESLRDFPCFFRYLNFIHQVDEYQLETEVYLPLK
ncbi:AraC family transcriptional regulator [Vibrio brasiliensis]|jgi:AraC family transcriptional regulator|uniref:AraC family transcriptional regulator n=1 Tax=Vibrio brasiliensis TaxID=170652 RepID=UPI001EFD6A68|nr:AraC family transcriptional regulator [Vibrio brasiliensis]MCG9782498.1 AraC family transcriptional regulator [Vibrio brasiliensis]